ncbi:MAG: hypothetical protein U1A78_31485 [Polyangia bacterium]
MEPISIANLPVRRYFALLGLNGQGERGGGWQTLSAEEYFAVLGGQVPRLNRNRAPCTEQRQTLGELFSGFVWE